MKTKGNVVYLCTRDDVVNFEDIADDGFSLDENSEFVLDTRFMKIAVSEKAFLKLRGQNLDKTYIDNFKEFKSKNGSGFLPSSGADMFLAIKSTGDEKTIVAGRGNKELYVKYDNYYIISLKNFYDFVDAETGLLTLETDADFKYICTLICYID